MKKEKITSKEIQDKLNEFLKKKEIEKLEDGVAENATTNGEVCACAWGKSENMKGAQRSQWIENQNLKRNLKKLKRIQKYRNQFAPATEAQTNYMAYLGVEIPENCTKQEASGLIKNELRKRRDGLKLLKTLV